MKVMKLRSHRGAAMKLLDAAMSRTQVRMPIPGEGR